MGLKERLGTEERLGSFTGERLERGALAINRRKRRKRERGRIDDWVEEASRKG